MVEGGRARLFAAGASPVMQDMWENGTHTLPHHLSRYAQDCQIKAASGQWQPQHTSKYVDIRANQGQDNFGRCGTLHASQLSVEYLPYLTEISAQIFPRDLRSPSSRPCFFNGGPGTNCLLHRLKCLLYLPPPKNLQDT